MPHGFCSGQYYTKNYTPVGENTATCSTQQSGHDSEEDVSARPYTSTPKLLNGFRLNFVLGVYTKSSRGNDFWSLSIQYNPHFTRIANRTLFFLKKVIALTGLLYFTLLYFTLLTPWCRIFLQNLSLSVSKNILIYLRNLKGSLPYSQKPPIGPYPEPAESSSPHRSQSP
jgi:hypothetical protein